MPPLPPNPPSQPLNRRAFLSRGATLAGAAALWSALGPKSWAATAAAAAEGPEVTDLNFGIIALTDCSPIVVAHEKGLFKKYGLNSTVTKGANWAAIRDSLSTGSIPATHMRPRSGTPAPAPTKVPCCGSSRRRTRGSRSTPRTRPDCACPRAIASP